MIDGAFGLARTALANSLTGRTEVKAIVRRSVAVVVLAVAELGRWINRAGTGGRPNAVLANNGDIPALAGLVDRAVGILWSALLGFAVLAIASFIHDAVAVIVDEVGTNFGRRLALRTFRSGRAGESVEAAAFIDAGKSEAGAGAGAGRADEEVLIDEPVAVVVLAVAELGHRVVIASVRHGRALRDIGLQVAFNDAFAAFADPLTDRAGIETVVDRAVAVVVNQITSFGFGKHLALAGLGPLITRTNGDT